MIGEENNGMVYVGISSICGLVLVGWCILYSEG